MGSLFKSKSEAVQDTGAMEAFQTVKPALQYATNQGINLGNEIFANPAFAGNRVANLNPFQVNSANTLGNFASNVTPAASFGAANLGFANLGAGMGFGNNAADIYSRAAMDPTSSIINAAGQYANNPYVDGLIAASGRDVTRQLFENTLPGIDRAATGAGNLNSTRTGVESAIATRGAADRLADLSSEIRSKFFGTGLNMAQNQFNQNLTNMLQSNQGLMQAGQFGLSSLSGAQDLANTGFGQGQSAGSVFQLQDQANLDANKAVFDDSLANRLAILQALSGVAGAGNGFRTTAGINTTPSVASQIGSVAKAFF